MSRVLRVPFGPLVPGHQLLPRELSSYVARVHRLRPGDPLVLFDPEAATEADAVVVEANARQLSLDVGLSRAAANVPTVRLRLVQALAKGDKMDRVLRDATALGATDIDVFESERSVPVLRGRHEARLGRWRSIAVDASRQCGRGDVPLIRLLPDAAAALAVVGSEVGFVLTPDATASLGNARDWSSVSDVALLVGPEGGLSPAELERATAQGYTPARLGMFVLRTELAGPAALAMIDGLRAR